MMDAVATFERGRREYPEFPFWDRCAVKWGNTSLPVHPLGRSDMNAVLARRSNRNLRAFPLVICRLPECRTVVIWPTPDKDYEVVLLERAIM